MSSWLTEKEFRQSGAEATGVTLNVAFMQEIKQDLLSVREQTSQMGQRLTAGMVTPRQAVDMLSTYRDSVETYFALEEFFGYFDNSAIINPTLSGKVNGLKQEHESLFLMLNYLIDLTEQIVYHECGPNTTLLDVAEQFEEFAALFQTHEQHEMELMMRLCNEELGVGD